ncbi:MAG: hypothetical protein ACFBSF_17700 [Leptolyngbyaceae cyanobacterium]
MWQSVFNYFQSLRTYGDLSPDRAVRWQVNQQLRHRPKLSFEAWSNLFVKQDTSIAPSLLNFVYTQLQQYSGLDVGRMRPSDRLIEDLQIPAVCWFDWALRLCDDFYNTFQIDISDEFDESLQETVGDLVYALNCYLQSMDSVPS